MQGHKTSHATCPRSRCAVVLGVGCWFVETVARGEHPCEDDGCDFWASFEALKDIRLDRADNVRSLIRQVAGVIGVGKLMELGSGGGGGVLISV